MPGRRCSVWVSGARVRCLSMLFLFYLLYLFICYIILFFLIASCHVAHHLTHRTPPRPAALPTSGDGNWRTPRGSRTGAWEALKKYIVRRYTVLFVDEVRTVCEYVLPFIFVIFIVQ